MLQKFASIDVTSVFTTEEDFNKYADSSPDALRIRKIVQYNPDFVYARFKAIGCIEVDGPNANADAFPYGEFLDNRPNYGYQSFIGKHAFIEHQSNNIDNSIGDLHHSYLNRFNTSSFNNRDWTELNSAQRGIVLAQRPPHEDGSVEVLMAIDRQLAPKIARMLETGSPTGCSMGTNIDYSECTICGKRAYVEEQYCPHIKYSKGQYVLTPATQISNLMKKGTIQLEWLPYILSRPSDIPIVKSAGRGMVLAKAFELNYGLSFFELSIVANPAFAGGYKLEKIATMNKPSSQLMPMVHVAGKPVEVIFKISNGYFTDLLGGDAQNVDIMYQRNGDIAKTALSSGNVHEVLVDKRNAPYFIKDNIELTAAETPGFYKVSNPEVLLDKTFASFRNRNKLGIVGTIEEKFFACPICKGTFDRNTQKKANLSNTPAFTTYSICKVCEDSAIQCKGEPYMANEKKAEYPSLPSTTEFTGDKEVIPGDGAFVGEKEQLYESWAEKGSNQIEKEKEYRQMGTIFIDPITAKSDLNSRSTRISELLKSATILLARTKMALGDPTSFLQEMTPSIGPEKNPSDSGAIPKDPLPLGSDPLGSDPLGSDPMGAGMVIEIDMTPESAPEILENVKGDLAFILQDLQKAKELTDQREVEASQALTNKIRWSKRIRTSAIKTAESVDSIIADAEDAINDALFKLDEAYKVLTGESSEDEVSSDEDTSETFENKVDSDKKTEDSTEKKSSPFDKDKKDDDDSPKKKSFPFDKGDDDDKNPPEGDDAMAKESSELRLTAGNIEILQKLRSALASDFPFNKKDDDDDDDDKSKSKDDEKKETSSTDKDDSEKKADKEASVVKEASLDKEATAMPPTGAKDPGDYGNAGAIEAHEMSRWWNDMYPEFEKMKSTEVATEFNEPEGRVELLTGFVGNKTPDDPEVGKQTNSPAIFAKRFVKNGPKWATSFIGVVKTAEDGTSEAFTANFRDIAGEDGADPEFEAFTSSAYLDEVIATVRRNGIQAALNQMQGKKAQLEGITPGKTEKVNPLYDTKEENKKSNQPRTGEEIPEGAGHGKGAGDKEYYGKAYGDAGYASDLVTAKTKIASLETSIADMQLEKRSNKLAEYSLHMARVSASRGIIPFDIANIQKQAMDYIQLDEKGMTQVKAHLEALPIVNRRALEAYQIPEAENMENGVIHNNLNVVDKVREQHTTAENVAPDGIQPAVERDAKVSAEQAAKIRKQAADQSIVPQMHMNSGFDPAALPDFTRHFDTIENRLKKVGAYESHKHLLRSNRR